MSRSSWVRSGLVLAAVAAVSLTGSVDADSATTRTAATTAAKPPLTKAQAKQRLLRKSDLPKGWVTSKTGGDTTASYSPARCRVVDGTPKGNNLVAEAAFEDPSDTGPLLDQTVYRPKQGSAKAEVKTINGLLKGCAKYTVKDEEITFTITLSPRKYKKLADGAIAYRGVTSVQGTKVTLQTVLVVVNREVVRFDSSGAGNGLSTKTLDALVKKGVKRLQTR